MKVVFIPKGSKKDRSDPRAYRPITLSNFSLKGLERIVQWYILDNIIPSQLQHQHAYTKGLSTETALSNLLNEIESQVHNGRLALVVSLDCTGAFDRIRYTSAERAMVAKNIPENIIKWYNNLLRNRSITADIQGTKKTIRPTQGSPQGGVLSPLVWNIIMDTLLSTFNQSDPVKIIGYLCR